MRYAIAVGSNRGTRARSIEAAAACLAARPDLRFLARSALWQTAPVGGPRGQGPFLNGAWLVASTLGPHALLAVLQEVERRVGRHRSVRNGPRVIDLDLLLCADGRCCRSPVLTLPHPELHRRWFALAPLVSIAPDWRVPPSGRTVEELWQQHRDDSRTGPAPSASMA